ncbi:MAG: ThiF family adenylyltransferase [Pseudomonadota bacterium]
MCAATVDTRYARHASLPNFGSDGVRALGNAHALIIGIGGTGCAAATTIATAGLGSATLCDFDTVDVSNLARQTLFSDASVGVNKARAARARLRALRPAMPMDVINHRMSADDLNSAVARTDIVLDCTDNFASRFMINRACVANAKTLVSGSAIRWEAQLAVFGGDYRVSPCYACVYRDDDESFDDCAGAGVLASLPATVGTMMAGEAIKALTQPHHDRSTLSLFDALSCQWQQLRIPKNPDCTVCGQLPEA